MLREWWRPLEVNSPTKEALSFKSISALFKFISKSTANVIYFHIQDLIFKSLPEFDHIKTEKILTSNNAELSKKGRNKLLYKTIHVDLIKNST